MGKSERLDSHPNYKQQTPRAGESLVEFTLRWAAHLVSPPKVDGESDENECTDIAQQILEIGSEVSAAWNAYHAKYQPITMPFTVIEQIVAERKHQVERGWTPQHDDKHHDDRSLAAVAASLASPHHGNSILHAQKGTLWDLVANRNKWNRRRQLVVAGALIVAELERLIRCHQGDTPRGKYGNCVDCDCPFGDPGARCPWNVPGGGLEDRCSSCHEKKLLSRGNLPEEEETKLTEALAFLAQESAAGKGVISVSRLQRGINLGYSPARRILEALSQRGYLQGDDLGPRPAEYSVTAILYPTIARKVLHLRASLIGGGYSPVEADELIESTQGHSTRLNALTGQRKLATDA